MVGKISASAILMVVISLWVLAMMGCAGSDPSPAATSGFFTVTPSFNTPDGLSEGASLSKDIAPMASDGVFRMETANAIVPDPTFYYGDFSAFLHAEIYSGLFKIVDNVNAPIELDLAERYSVLNGGKTYEIVLRRGLQFSDGSPVTMSDVAWSWARALSPATGSQRAQSILGAISGADVVADGLATELSGVAVVDDRTLKVDLSYPASNFLASLADPVAYVLKPENVANWGVDFSILRTKDWAPFRMNEMPIGTGPFKIDNYKYETGQVWLSRNDYFHGPPAKLSGIEFVPKKPSEIDRFATGDVDLTFFFPDARTAGSDPSLIPIPEPPSSTFLAFNSAVPPFDDVHFRRALQSSTDVAALGGIWQPASGLLHPDLPGFNENLPSIAYDPVYASELLQKSQYVDDIGKMRLSLHEYLEEGFGGDLENIADAWFNHLGLSFSVHRISSEASYRRELVNGEVQMVYRTAYNSYPSQEEFLWEFVTLFGEDNDAPEFVQARLMLEQAVKLADAVKRLEAYADVERYIVEEALIVPLFWTSAHDGRLARIQPWVEGFNPSAYHSGSIFREVWFNASAPERQISTE